jgi:Fic-DOC domain mobile mystery protein B
MVPDPLHGEDVAGNTPLGEDEADGLIPDLQTRGELNAWEQANILKAEAWAFGRRRQTLPENILTREFVVALHRRMLDETWTWAGQFRRSEKSIGVAWETILPALQDLLDDASHWIANGTYAPDEFLARFHHRLVSIHPFPNGNGRHARLMTDVLARNIGLERPTWGLGDLSVAGHARVSYLNALKQADKGNIALLVTFLRS